MATRLDGLDARVSRDARSQGGRNGPWVVANGREMSEWWGEMCAGGEEGKVQHTWIEMRDLIKRR